MVLEPSRFEERTTVSKTSTTPANRELRYAVVEALAREPTLSPGEIAVSVQDGVVTLSGYVGTYTEKCTALDLVTNVAGVSAVADQVRVRVPSAFGPSDTDLAGTLVDALTRELRIPVGSVKITVQDGWVTLKGHVANRDQRAAAERAAHALPGVVGISNLIEVPTSNAPDGPASPPRA
jgi:osmotically-inducible protein OsmY